MLTDRTRLSLTALLLVAGLVFATPLRILGQADGPESLVLEPVVRPEVEQAIERGLDYLVRTQERDGPWRSSGSYGNYPVAMTSLAGLALLASGSTATEGPYAPSISGGMNFILNSQRADGLIARPEEDARPMHGHGYAMLFLAELYGMEGDPGKQQQIRDALKSAVELTARSQSDKGGWIYLPGRNSDEGSVTITQLQGLRACRNAGIAVPKEVIDQAMAYLEASALPDGGIAYRVGSRGDSRPPITAAAVACWYNAGQYDNPLAKRALEYSIDHVGTGTGSGRMVWGHFYYAHLYMSQIMWLSSEKNWDWYFPPMSTWLLEKQKSDGSWDGDAVGTTYGTSIALIILQMPYGYLPILQR